MDNYHGLIQDMSPQDREVSKLVPCAIWFVLSKISAVRLMKFKFKELK